MVKQMSEWRLIRLNFGRNPVHFGELGIGIEETSERVRSDTLFSAWMSMYARLFGKNKVGELLTKFPVDSQSELRSHPKEVPFRLSSTFVFRRIPQADGNDRYIDYLPRLLEFPRHYPIHHDLEFSKTYKKLSYLPLEVWQRWYQGAGFNDSDREELTAKTQDQPISDGELKRTGTFDYGQTFGKAQIPKIAVDRTTRATNLFHTGFVRFHWESIGNRIKSLTGLYFLLHFPEANAELEAELQAALALLAEEGIGGERSSGAGRFEFDWQELPETWQQVVNHPQGDRYGLISLFWELPLPATIITDATKYTLQERSGWIASPFSGRQLRRKAVQMFAEGSVFPKEPLGQLANVTPDQFKAHKIYRSGLALSLPIC
jgi:CRISPR-associated protein Csm4